MNGRKGRKCLYANCGHHQNMVGKVCKFHQFPKDTLQARLWLTASGVTTVTPKKIVPSWTICSCHFPNGRHGGSLPEEYIGEFDSDDDSENLDAEINPLKRPRGSPLKGAASESPARKNLHRSLTPNTKDAVDTLLFLPNTVPIVADAGLSIKEEILSPVGPTYSPKKSYWSLRGSVLRHSARKSLSQMVDFTIASSHVSSLNESLHEDIDNDDNFDLGCSSLPTEQDIIETLHEDKSFPSTPHNDTAHDTLDEDPITEISSLVQNLSPPRQKVVETRSIGIQCDRPFLGYDKCKLMSEKDFAFYTGLTQDMFELLYEFLGGDEVCTQLKYNFKRKTPTKLRESELTPKDRLFLTLLRLRRGIILRDLKILFNISEAYTSKIFYTWIRFMAEEFKKLQEVMFVSAPAQDGLRPPCFQDFPNLRVIIDCTEFRIQRPKHLQQQRDTFSDYKSACTVKFLIGISCMGGLSYISEGYEGSISDRSLVEKSGFLDRVDPGDAIMADKGFDIEDKCDARGIELLIPSFKRRRDHFTARELIWSRVIAESRVHVETFIGKLKCFRLIRYVIPNAMLAVCSDIVTVCAMLVNFQQPFISIPDKQ